GHIAACTGVIDGFSNGEVSSKPNAMVLYNPVLDTTRKGYGAGKLGANKTEISPCHHIKKGIPPTLVCHGTKDTTVPFENAERFTRLMKKAGNSCTLMAAEGEKHGFFNGKEFRPKGTNKNFNLTMAATKKFLKEHKLLPKEQLTE
ncbi:MAG: alpha/beta hydrolase, partial [Akkermansiaceae bacterium]